MKMNMGAADRVIRTLIAIVIGVLWFTGRIHGTLGIVLCAVAAIFLLTSLFGWCPTYLPFGMSTKKQPPATPAA